MSTHRDSAPVKPKRTLSLFEDFLSMVFVLAACLLAIMTFGFITDANTISASACFIGALLCLVISVLICINARLRFMAERNSERS